MSRASRGDVTKKENSHFSTTLRKLMDEEPITTQAKLAEITGKSRQTVSQYIHGISEPGYDTLGKIADYFHVSVDYLLSRSDIRTTDPDIKAVCAYTGLSETSVGSILRETANKDTQKVMNIILGFDPDCFHRFIQSVGKGIAIVEKYRNKSINLESIPTEIKEDLYCLLGIEDGGIYDPVGNTRDRYFTKAKGYLDLLLTSYTVSPDGKPMVSFGFDEDSVEEDGVPNGID